MINFNPATGWDDVEEALVSSDVGQQWERLAIDGSGFFALKIPNSGPFLAISKWTQNTLTTGT